MRSLIQALFAACIALAGPWAAPALAQYTPSFYRSDSTDYLLLALEMKCGAVLIYQTELIQAQQDLEIAQFNYDQINARVEAAIANKVGRTLIVAGVVIYDGPREFSRSGALRDSFYKHVETAERAVSVAQYMLEWTIPSCESIRIVLAERAAAFGEPQQAPDGTFLPSGRSPGGDAEDREDGSPFFDQEALDRAIAKLLASLELAAAEAPAALEAAQALAGLAPEDGGRTSGGRRGGPPGGDAVAGPGAGPQDAVPDASAPPGASPGETSFGPDPDVVVGPTTAPGN